MSNFKFLFIILPLILVASSLHSLNIDVVNELSIVHTYDKNILKIIEEDYELAILFGVIPEHENILFERLFNNHDLLNKFIELYFARECQLSRHSKHLSLKASKEDLEDEIESIRKIYKTHLVMEAFNNFCIKTHKRYLIEPFVVKEYVGTVLENLLTAHFIKSFEAQEGLQFLGQNPDAKRELQDILSKNYALPFRFIEFDHSIIVKQSSFGIFDLNNKAKDCIVSSPLRPCMAIIVYNARLETYGYLHVDQMTSAENIIHFFQELNSFTSDDSIEVKIIAYHEEAGMEDLQIQFAPCYPGHNIRDLPFSLIKFLRLHIFPRIANLSVIENDEYAVHIGHEEYPELALLRNAHGDVEGLKCALENSASFLSNLDCYEALFHQEKNPLNVFFQQCVINKQTPAYPDFDKESSLSFFKSNLSFGIDKSKRWFTTNYVLSGRALPTNSVHDLARLSYAMRGGIPINNGYPLFRAITKILK